MVSRVDLTGVDVVYLSSCESSYGEGGVSDEVMGLVHVLLAAGARCVIGHLYPIDDAMAARQSIAFYEALGAGATTREAYRSAVAAGEALEGEPVSGEHDRSYVADWMGLTLYGDPSVRILPQS
jgi:hypothetical protein